MSLGGIEYAEQQERQGATVSSPFLSAPGGICRDCYTVVVLHRWVHTASALRRSIVSRCGHVAWCTVASGMWYGEDVYGLPQA